MEVLELGRLAFSTKAIPLSCMVMVSGASTSINLYSDRIDSLQARLKLLDRANQE